MENIHYCKCTVCAVLFLNGVLSRDLVYSMWFMLEDLPVLSVSPTCWRAKFLLWAVEIRT